MHTFLYETAKEAGAILKEKHSHGFRTTAKHNNPRDIVTEADYAVNDFLTKEIRRHFPDDSIYSEEAADIDRSDTRKWFLDPIDGSSNFSRNIPHFSTCFGVLEDDEPRAGCVYNPMTDEFFSFERGKGAFLGGEPISVSPTATLKEAHVLFHAGRRTEYREWGGDSYAKLLAGALKTKNFGSSALDICFVAAGRVDAYISGSLTTRDIAPVFGLLREAGGVCSDERGKPLTFTTDQQRVFVANNDEVLAASRNLLIDAA